MLRLDRFGRHVLSRDQRIGSTVFGLVFAALLAAAVWWQVSESQLGKPLTIDLAVLSLCVAATWSRRGQPRMMLGFGTVALAAIATVSLVMLHLGNPLGEKAETAFLYGFIAFQFTAIGMRGR